MNEQNDILLIYDKQCPACNYYCHLVNIRQDVGELKLIDAREDSKVMDEITTLGLDIDQGMVLKYNNNIYYGADAIHALALLGSNNGFFNRFNAIIFRSKFLSLLIYPILRFFRNLLLKVLHKSKINNLHLHDNDRF